MSEDSSISARDHLANERTHLAWLRTAANVMVLGLVVARFGDNGNMSASSLLGGGLLVVTGIAGVAYGAARCRAMARDLAAERFDASGRPGGLMVASAVLVASFVGAAIIVLR